MNDIKMLAENEKELETDRNNKNIQPGYRNGILHRKICQSHDENWIKINNGRNRSAKTKKNQKKMKIEENENIKYLGILKAEPIKQMEMKEKKKKDYLRRTRKLLETKLCSRNLVKEINTWAVPSVRYSELYLKWTREEELKQKNRRTTKLMTMHKALHPRNDKDRLYV